MCLNANALVSIGLDTSICCDSNRTSSSLGDSDAFSLGIDIPIRGSDNCACCITRIPNDEARSFIGINVFSCRHGDSAAAALHDADGCAISINVRRGDFYFARLPITREDVDTYSIRVNLSCSGKVNRAYTADDIDAILLRHDIPVRGDFYPSRISRCGDGDGPAVFIIGRPRRNVAVKGYVHRSSAAYVNSNSFIKSGDSTAQINNSRTSRTACHSDALAAPHIQTKIVSIGDSHPCPCRYCLGFIVSRICLSATLRRT